MRFMRSPRGQASSNRKKHSVSRSTRCRRWSCRRTMFGCCRELWILTSNSTFFLAQSRIPSLPNEIQWPHKWNLDDFWLKINGKVRKNIEHLKKQKVLSENGIEMRSKPVTPTMGYVGPADRITEPWWTIKKKIVVMAIQLISSSPSCFPRIWNKDSRILGDCKLAACW